MNHWLARLTGSGLYESLAAIHPKQIGVTHSLGRHSHKCPESTIFTHYLCTVYIAYKAEMSYRNKLEL